MIGETFLQDLSLWSCSWQSVAFIALGMVISYLLRNRPSRAYQVLLFAMITAIAVPFMSVMVKHYNLGVFTTGAIDSSRISLKVPVTTYPGEVGIAPEMETSSVVMPTPVNSEPTEILSILSRISWRMVMLYGWIATTLVLLIRLAVTFIYGAHVIRHAHRKGCEKIQEAADRSRSKFQIAGVLEVHASKHVRSPVAWCWTSPPILLVPNTCKELSIDWMSVVIHELAHWKRQDHITGLVAELTICLLPWNPLMWLAKKHLVKLGEEACDDWVIAIGQHCEEYAESLLRFRPQRQMAFLPAVVHTEKGLAGRIHRILKDSCANPRTGVMWTLTVGIATVFVAVGVAFAQTRPEKSQTFAETQTKSLQTLHEAAASGDIVQVKSLVSKDADVNIKDKWGSTPLHTAANKGHMEIAKFLIAKGADVNIKDKWGWTPLHRAAMKGHSEIAKVLISKGANVNTKNTAGWTALHLAASGGHKDMVELLIDSGANLSVDKGDDDTPTAVVMASTVPVHKAKAVIELLVAKGAKVSDFHLAAYMGDIEKLRKYIQNGTDINLQDECGSTALHAAANSGNKEIAEYLISQGAHLDAKQKELRLTPLYYAAIHNHQDIVDLLLAKGADINTKDESGYTLLHNAIFETQKDAVELLIKKGAEINIKTGSGHTPLINAVWTRNREIVELLINNGADVNAEDKNGRTALDFAKQIDDTEIVNLLLQHGAKKGTPSLLGAIASGDIEQVELLISQGEDINTKNQQGQTLLHQACFSGNKEMAELLIAKGADLEAKNKSGSTPLHQACSRGDKDMAAFLISKGADIEAKNKWGGTPLHDAAQNGQIEAINLLLDKGANIENGNRWGRRALYIAVMYSHPEVVELLLAKGADINAKTYYDDTPLHTAVKANDKEMVELLLNKGADIRARQVGYTPIASAMWKDQKEMVQFLKDKKAEFSQVHVAAYLGHSDEVMNFLSSGGDINLKDPSGLTLIHTAIYGGHLQVIESLIERGANLNIQDNFGWTPLHTASAAGRQEITRFLLGIDADTTLDDKTGRTALHWAAEKGHKAIVEVLLDKGSDVNAKSGIFIAEGEEDGAFTPLHEACANGHKDIAEVLIAHGANISARTKNGDTALSWAKKEYELKDNPIYKEVMELLRMHGAKE